MYGGYIRETVTGELCPERIETVLMPITIPLWIRRTIGRIEKPVYTFEQHYEFNFPSLVIGDPVDSYDIVMGDVTGDQKDDVVLFYGWSEIQIYYYDSGQYKRFIKNFGNGSMYETGCLPNVDDDSFILRDTGGREMLFSDPHVIAVLASPPYYEGLNEDGDGGTSFGYNKSKGESSGNSFGFSIGASIGTEFKIPIIEVGTEVEATLKASFAWAQSNSIEISESWGWNNPIAQDLVVFTAIPFDVYYYEVVSSPPGEEARPGDILTVNVPRKPYPYHMPLPSYNARVPEEHRIRVNHTLGDPASYYTRAERDAQRGIAVQGLFSQYADDRRGGPWKHHYQCRKGYGK
jgi:hypothetical protein